MFDVVFYILAAGLCGAALLTVIARDVFHSAVWLSFTLLGVAAIYFLLDASFLGVIQILVYIGGIITLFIFAIKLTASIGDIKIKQTNEQAILAGIVTLVLLFLFFRVLPTTTWASGVGLAAPLSLKQLGMSLMTVYVFPFEYLSLILLAALIGAIIIGKVGKVKK